MELKQDALLAGAMRASFDCIIVIDEAGLVVDWNPASEHTFGFSKEEAIGRSVAELIIPPERHDAHRSGLKRYVAGGESRILNQRMRLEACRSDGSRLPVEIAVTEVDVDGHGHGVGNGHVDGDRDGDGDGHVDVESDGDGDRDGNGHDDLGHEGGDRGGLDPRERGPGLLRARRGPPVRRCVGGRGPRPARPARRLRHVPAPVLDRPLDRVLPRRGDPPHGRCGDGRDHHHSDAHRPRRPLHGHGRHRPGHRRRLGRHPRGRALLTPRVSPLTSIAPT